MKNYLLAALVLTLSACATPEKDRVSNIATTPLRDFNLSNAAIPPVLVEAKAKPYVAPHDQSCESLFAQVGVLDAVLGPDVDAEAGAEPGRGERARSALGSAAAGALQRTVEGAIPFRGWVRKLSGAERHSAEVAAAIAAGTARRAFLKGIALARTCQAAPASGT